VEETRYRTVVKTGYVINELILRAYCAVTYCFSSALWFQTRVLTVRKNDFHTHAYNHRIKNEV